MLHLYHSAYSTCSQKVRLALFEKGLAFDTTEMEFWRGDHLTPEYLAINPNGVVPTLVHDGQPILDSSVIVEYLDEVFPNVRLSPIDPVARANMRSWMRYLEEVPTTAIRVPSFNKVFRKLRTDLSDQELEDEADRRPLRKGFYKEMGREGFNDARYEASLAQLQQTITRMEQALTANRFLCGENLTLADICVIPTIDRMRDIGFGDMVNDARCVRRWWNDVEQRDSFANTFYPGTRVSERYEVLPNGTKEN
jgi:glutathione S-transferase